MRTTALPASVALLSVLTLLLGAGVPPVAAAPEEPRVAVRTLDLSRVEGRLAALDAKRLQLRTPGAAEARTFALDEVIHLHFAGEAQARSRLDRFRAYLIGGEELLGRFAGPTEDGIVLDVAGLGRVPLLFEHILTLESVPADAGACHDVARHPRPKSGDLALDERGDEYAGTVLEATKDELVLESKRGRKRRVAWDVLELVHLENDPLKPAEGVRGEVELRDGSRLAAAKIGLTEKGLRVTLRSLPETTFTVRFDAVKTIRWAGGRFEYASTLPVTSTWKQPYEDPEGLMDPAHLESLFGMRVDRRTSGCPLRVGGETYRHGFGVNSHSTVTIPLAGKFTSFRCSFGIDDQVLEEAAEGGRKGDVDARVLADGKVLWEAKGVQGGQKPRRIGPLDVKGVKSLVLEVGFGKHNLTLDRADWGDPILVKAK